VPFEQQQFSVAYRTTTISCKEEKHSLATGELKKYQVLDA
jgi:hypothetical protein